MGEDENQNGGAYSEYQSRHTQEQENTPPPLIETLPLSTHNICLG